MEALAIAIVFCMMMGLSIHRLSAVPVRTSLASGMLKAQNDLQSTSATEKILASSLPVVPRTSRQSPSGGRADIVSEDIVIRHQKHAVDLACKPGVGLNFARDADTVVQYGSDVKMWSRKRVALNRLGH